EINEEPAQGEARPVNGRLADFPVKPDARTFQSQRQLLAVSIKKTFHGYDGHAFALIAGGSDRLRGRAVRHNGINVYLVAAGITRRGDFQPPRFHNGVSPKHVLWGAQAPACNRRQLADDVVFGKLPALLGFPKNDARFRSRIEFLCRMIHRSSRLVFAITLAFATPLIFAVVSILAAPVEQSPPPVTPTPEAKPSPVVVLSPAATPSKAVENSVVKIFATLRLPD